MLIYSMGVSVDGFIADRRGQFAWTYPTNEQFLFHLEEVCGLGGYLMGRRLYEAMLGWETDPSLQDLYLGAEFAAAWSALPKVVFSRTRDAVQGSARLAAASLPEEIAALASAGKDISIGGAGLASAAIELDLVDEFHIMRHPIVVGGGTPYFPPVLGDLPLDLVETRTFGSPVLYERYRRVRGNPTN